MTTADEIAAEQYRFGDVSVDCSNFRVVRNGEVVPLRPRDFDVLVYLLRNTGRVVEKQELFESVWGDTFVSDNALTKIIKEIRLVLGDRADNPIYIETVPKRGYRFIGKIEYLGSAGPDAESSEDKTRSEVQRVSELAGASWRSFPGADRRLVAAIGLVASVAFAAWIWTRAASEPPSDAIQSIAVMPFINQSADPDVEYLADGITESLVAALSRVPRLSVKSRSSVFRYKGKDVSPGVVGRELGVRTIVSGRVVQRGAEVVMYVELIETATGNVMWKSNFTRPMRDLLSVEREIARNLSQQLSTKLSSADEQDVSNTRVPEAYQDYLRGRFHWNKRTVADFRKSLEYFQRAIDADPDYARAYAGLAASYTELSEYGGAEPADAIAKAHKAALKALSLDDQLAAAHLALALAMNDDYDFEGAEREFRRAIELDPDDASIHQLYGVLLTELGHHDEAISEARLAIEIDPLSLGISRSYADSLFYARRYDEALEQVRETLELDTNFTSAYATLFNILRMQGQHAESVEAYAKYHELRGEMQDAAVVRDSFARGGWKGFLRAMSGASRPASITSYLLSTFHAELGNKDQALTELEKAFAGREYFIARLNVDPRCDNIRGEVRFQELLRKSGLVTAGL